MTMQNGNIPDLGAVRGPKPRAGTGFQALVRTLDAAGTYEPAQVVRGPNGQPLAVPDRSQYVDAEQLVEWIGDELDRRLRAFAVRFGLAERDQ